MTDHFLRLKPLPSSAFVGLVSSIVIQFSSPSFSLLQCPFYYSNHHIHSRLGMGFSRLSPSASSISVAASLWETSPDVNPPSGACSRITFISSRRPSSAFALRQPLPPTAGGQLPLPPSNPRISRDRTSVSLRLPLRSVFMPYSQPHVRGPTLPDAAGTLPIKALLNPSIFVSSMGALFADDIDLATLTEPQLPSVAALASVSVPSSPLLLFFSSVLLTASRSHMSVTSPFESIIHNMEWPHGSENYLDGSCQEGTATKTAHILVLIVQCKCVCRTAHSSFSVLMTRGESHHPYQCCGV